MHAPTGIILLCCSISMSASRPTCLTSEAVAKLLNHELHVAASDIHDAILDYFTITEQSDDSDTNLDDDECDVPVPDILENIDVAVSVRANETFGSSVSCEQVDECSVPMIHNCLYEAQELAKQICPEATNETELVDKFIAEGCKCKRNCCQQFTAVEIVTNRLQLRDINFYDVNHLNAKNETITGQLAVMCDSGKTISSSHRKKSERTKTRNTLMFHGKEVCLPIYLFINDIGIKRYKLLKKRYLSTGLQPHMHGHSNRRAKHALTFTDCERVVLFIKHYSEQCGLVLPGRVPGFKSADLVLLPSNLTKRELHRQYVNACSAAHTDSIGYDSFLRIWRLALPNTVIQKPRSDLCSTCNNNLTSMSKYRGMSDEEKLEKLTSAMNHLELVKRERKVYTDAIAAAREAVSNLQFPHLGPHLPCSSDVTLHISFDYAQQVHVPFDPQQPGEIYFLVPFKVGLFGIMNEGLNKQVTYLIPESVAVGKGSNAVISYPITILLTMDWESNIWLFMRTTVQDRIKIIS